MVHKMENKEHGDRNQNYVSGCGCGKWIANLDRLVKTGSIQKSAFKHTLERGGKR